MAISKILLCLVVFLISLATSLPNCNNEYCRSIGGNHTRISQDNLPTFQPIPQPPIRLRRATHLAINRVNSTTTPLSTSPPRQPSNTSPTHDTKAETFRIQTTQLSFERRAVTTPFPFNNLAAIFQRSAQTARPSHKARSIRDPDHFADPAAVVHRAPQMKILPVRNSISTPTSGQSFSTAPENRHAKTTLTPVAIPTADVPDEVNTSTETPCSSSTISVQGANTFTSIWNGIGPRPYGGGLIHIPTPTTTTSQNAISTSLAKRKNSATKPTATCTTRIFNGFEFTDHLTKTFWAATATSTIYVPCHGCALKTYRPTHLGPKFKHTTTTHVTSTRTMTKTTCLTTTTRTYP